MLTKLHDDCFRAALATVTQIPVQEVFDVLLRGRLAAGADVDDLAAMFWDKCESWLESRGLRATFHKAVPLDRERWIGIVPPPPPEDDTTEGGHGRPCSPFSAHTLVMTRDRILFDPAISLRPPPGMRLRQLRPSDVVLGIAIQPMKE